MTDNDIHRNDAHRARRARDRHAARGGRAADTPDLDVRLRRRTGRSATTTTRVPATRRATRSPGAIADLEGGAGAVVTSSGMAAVTLVAQLFRPDAARRRAARLLRRNLSPVQCACTSAARCACASSISATPAALAAALDERAGAGLDRDAEQPAAAHRRHRARRRAPGVPPARWSWPTTRSCRRSGRSPLRLGADVVVHSTTKYLNGHSDVVGGAVIAATRRAARAARVVGQLHRRDRRALRQLSDVAGAAHAACPHAQLTARMPPRVAAMLPRIRRSRASTTRACRGHPGHEIAREQQQGFGAMVSFELRGGLARVPAFLDDTRALLARRVARRRREPGRASGQHDARGDGRDGARTRAGITDETAAALDRYRGRRRSRARPRAGARRCAERVGEAARQKRKAGCYAGLSGTGPEQPQSVRQRLTRLKSASLVANAALGPGRQAVARLRERSIAPAF